MVTAASTHVEDQTAPGNACEPDDAPPAGVDDDTGDAPPSEPVLNQDEINSLLGFGDGDHATGGIHAVLNSSTVSYERLPMLEVVFERLVRLMSISLRQFTSETVEVSLDSIQSVRFGDHMNAIPLPALLSVIQAEPWDNGALISVDSALVYSVVDVLLGGRRGTAAMRIEGRPYTTIERTLVERMVRVVLGDLGAAFAPLSTVAFRFERLETNPRFVAITRPSNAAIHVRLRIDMDDRGGEMDLVIPYATLEPIRDLLLQMFMGEKFGRDRIWEHHLADTLRATEVELTAVLDACSIPLAEVMELKVGSRILFNRKPDAAIEMQCGRVPMYLAKVGRRGGNLAVQIENRINSSKQGR
jgi:flagellar motor switch protein FliM